VAVGRPRRYEPRWPPIRTRLLWGAWGRHVIRARLLQTLGGSPIGRQGGKDGAARQQRTNGRRLPIRPAPADLQICLYQRYTSILCWTK
jgi:hypothetical protein